MTSHELAKLLLEREDLPILTPKAVSWCDEGTLQDIVVQEFEAELVEGGNEKVMLVLGVNPV